MSSGSPTVKLTFAGDSASLDQTFARVAASSETVTHKLKDTSAQAKALKTTMRGAGDAAQIFGGELGSTAVTAGYGLSAIKDLSKGIAGLIPVVKASTAAWLENTSAMTKVKFGLIGVAAATAGMLIGTDNLKKWGLEPLSAQLHIVGDVLNKLPGGFFGAGDAAQNAAHKVDVMRGTAVDTAAALRDAAAAAYQFETQMYQLRNQPADTNPGGDAFATGLNDVSMIDALSPTRIKSSSSGGGGSSASRSIQSQADKIATAAKDAAAKLKSARRSVAEAVGGIVAAFAGHLEAGDPNNLLIKSLGTDNSLLAKLRKQAADTKHFADDLKKLSKLGLSKGLLSDLVAGGLGSLGAADELLRGGKSSVSTANSLNASIAASGQAIAVGEVSRNLTKKDLGTIKVDLTGAESDVKKMFRKWLRTDGANSFGLAAA